MIYDFVLVRFLAARLGFDLGLKPVTPPPVNSGAAIRFAIFLAVHSDFTASEPIEKFTMLLDDFRFQGFIDADFVKQTLAGAERQLNEKQERRFASLCLGLVLFVQSLGDFFLELEGGERPFFGAIYAYWLAHFFGLRHRAKGYPNQTVSFEDVKPDPILFPRNLDPTALELEQQRFQNRIGVLRETWEQTRSLIASLDVQQYTV